VHAFTFVLWVVYPALNFLFGVDRFAALLSDIL